ncbi:hypothetical protein FJU30_07995 [Affinibrenneria salicis]|uniref:Uncharacterized protein n=1 Tax=Affinibrenneria salicis TaxID=2590031 RepID=A0A5J5G2Q2_9GAMM|nr:hypothetical protein [Affinibrenneria salicis]KAA9001177.1 hypothetical protein FJU30_07995 [Affinibrenneria salicis]
MNNPGYICLPFMLLVGAMSFLLAPPSALIFPALAVLFSCGYFIYFIVRKGLHRDVFKALLFSLAIVLIAFIPIVGWLILIAFAIYNITQSLVGLKSLLQDIVTSALFYALLFARFIFDISSPLVITLLAIGWLALSVIYCRRLNTLPLREALFKISVMWLSIPLAALTLVSIMSSLSSLFRITSSTLSRSVINSQSVAGHIRAGGYINPYTREVTRTVSETVTRVTPGAGAVTSAVTKEVAQTVRQPDEDDPSHP